MSPNPYTIFDVSVLDAIEKQAVLDGWMFLALAILCAVGIFIGYLLISSFLKSENKENEKWLLRVGVVIVAVCTLLCIIFAWMSIGRLLNPSYYAVEYLKGMLKIQRKLLLPF